jgi:hypothetical protein
MLLKRDMLPTSTTPKRVAAAAPAMVNLQALGCVMLSGQPGGLIINETLLAPPRPTRPTCGGVGADSPQTAAARGHYTTTVNMWTSHALQAASSLLEFGIGLR